LSVPRYRIIDVRGAYMARSPEIKLLQFGSEHRDSLVYSVRAPLCELIAEGEEIEFDGIPGPHMEPLNDAARQRMREYRQANPHATLDPTSTLGVGGGSSIDLGEMLTLQMDRMLREATGTHAMPAVGDASVLESLRAQVVELSAQVAALLKARVPAARKTAS